MVWSAVAALLVTFAGLAGSGGWVLRDRAARQAERIDDLEAAVKDVQQFQIQGKWPEAEAVAIRADDLLKDGHWSDLAERVHGLLADCRLVVRLEEIRLLQSDVRAKENHFAPERALPEYRQAFKEYGLEMSTVTPKKAAELLQARSLAVHSTLVVALEDWLDLARQIKGMEADWLQEVLSLTDSDPWRQSLRAARKSKDRPALERLAQEVDIRAQPPQVLIMLDRALHDCGAKEGALALLKCARQAFPGDFWINHDLGVALQECQPPQYEEAIRFLTAAEALRPQSPGVRLNLGLALKKSGRLDEAVAAFRQAIELKPDYAAAHYTLGMIFQEKGELDKALAACRHAVQVTPDDLQAQWNLGVALANMDQKEEAVAIYDHVLALQANFIETHYDPATQRSLKSWHDYAVATLRKSANRKPKHAATQDSPVKEKQKGEQ